MKNMIKFVNVLKITFLLHFSLSCVPAFSEMHGTLFSTYVYQLSSNEDKRVYIFGSSHVATRNIPVHLSQCVKDIFTKADYILLEVDQLAASSYSVASRSTVNMGVVSKYIDADILKFMTDGMFGSRSPDAVDRLEQMDAQILLNMLLSRVPGINKLLGQPDFGLDVELTMAGRFMNKKIDYIEMPEDQVRFFRLVRPEVYASAITAITKLIQNKSAADLYLDKSISLMYAAANGDEDGIVYGLKLDGFDKYFQTTVTDRNESLAEKISSRLSNSKDKDIFIALGAAHLAGEGSVVQRLKSKGYTAMRLCL